jgi:hypothetical protein
MSAPSGPLDGALMLRVFQRRLPELASMPIRVTRCTVSGNAARRASPRQRTRVIYRVSIESAGGRRWEHTLVGTVPVPPDFLSPELLFRCRAAQRHPAAAPFAQLATYIEDLEMAVVLLPIDPALPGLADVTGGDATKIVARHLPECRRGAILRQVGSAITRYSPYSGALVRMEAVIANGAAPQSRRAIYVKVFCDDRGELYHRNLVTLWDAARRSSALRVPEPLGYDPELRLLFMSEAPGQSQLHECVKRLETGQGLPEGFGAARFESGLRVAAGSIAELQRAPITHPPERTFRHELARLHRAIDALRAGHPEPVRWAAATLDAIKSKPLDEERLVPAHGAFEPARMLGDGERLTIVKWGGLCLAPPALDAATFLGRLRRVPLRRPGRGGGLDQAAAVFRAEFLRCRPEVSAGELAAYESMVLLEIALRVLRASRNDGVGRVRGLLAEAERLAR